MGWDSMLCSVLFWEVSLLSYVLSIKFRTYLGTVTIEQITPQQVREAEKSLKIMESMIQSMTPSTIEVPLSIHVVRLFRCCLWGVSYFLRKVIRFQFVCNSYNSKIKGLPKNQMMWLRNWLDHCHATNTVQRKGLIQSYLPSHLQEDGELRMVLVDHKSRYGLISED